MSVKDGKDYLYLIWKSEQSRKQYVVGELTKNGLYKFQYCEKVDDAIDDGFVPLICFLEEYDEYTLLKRSGARIPIDSLEFIDTILDDTRDVRVASILL